MANDPLIAALESQRDAYSQRQRATNALLAALKGTTGSLGKAARALNEYTASATTLEASKLERTRQAFAALRLKDEAIDPLLPDLRREVKTLKEVQTALKDASTALPGDAVDVVKLARAHRLLQMSKVRDAAIDALLPDLER